MTHIERTLAVFKDSQFMIEKVERFNTFAGCRQDLFGFLDLLAVHPSHGTWGIQVCGTDFNSHVKKMTGERREALLFWLLGGNRCILIGWRKLKASGWTPRIQEFTLADFPEITPEVLKKLRAKNYEKNSDKWLTDLCVKA